MEALHKISPKSGDVVLLVGTMKGAFLLHSDRGRQKWQVAGPYFRGETVYAMAYDGRNGRHRIWAGVRSFHFGAVLRTSDDFGKNWITPETPTIRFPEGTGASLQQIWQITPGREDEPDTLYCGVEPAALFVSRDAGRSWALVQGLFDHPHRPKWQPGAGGLCLHTILPDPSNRERMQIAISAAGVYRTEDGGRTWQVSNRGIRAEFVPDKYPEFGQCVHKMVRHPARPERLFLQNHWGLYRSEDQGGSWKDIAKGVPSDFGFAMVMHPHDPDTVYIVPIESDEFRCTPEAKLRVYRTTNGGRSWQALTRGLPQKGAFETVLRDNMAADSLRPCGVYFGTRSGKLYGSRTEGDSWRLILDGLPAVVCVKAGVVGEASVARKPAARRAGKTSTQKKAGRRAARRTS